MARTLSSIAVNGIIILLSFAATAMLPRAWAESDVAVAPATNTVENPFTKRLRAPQSTAVPREAEDEPRSAQVIDLAALLMQSLGKRGGAKRLPERAVAPVPRGKPALRVVPATRRAAKAPAKRKRA